MPSRQWLGGLCLLAGLITGLVLAGAESSTDYLQEALDRAAELNVTAPWPKSQEILDEIEPLLDQATPDQYATHQLLVIRNLALDGNMQAGLELTDELLNHAAIPDHQRLNALLRGTNLAMLARQFEQAFAYLNEALELEPHVNHRDLPTDVFSLAAQMLASVGEFERSIEYGNRSVERAVSHHNVRVECVARQRLASALKDAQRLDEARGEYEAGLKACEAANDPVFVSIVEYAIGDILRLKGDFQQARPWLDSALEGHKDNQYVHGIHETRLALALLHLELGQLEKSYTILSELVEHFERNQNWNRLSDTQQALAEIARQRNDPDQALIHYEAHMEARVQFLGRERSLRLAYLEVEFDTQFKEQELALLREQARVRELETETLAQQRYLRNLFYVVTAFLVVILILLLTHTTRERRHYRSLSRRDGLTRLNNHTRFFELAEPAFEQARVEGMPFSLILADIDHFKRINDLHGHLAGDAVLRRVAARVHEVFDDIGITGRVGGEEFAIALPGYTADQAFKPLEELRRRLGAMRTEDNDIRVSMSFGVAQTTEEETFNALRRRADEALYEAKHGGRDQYRLAGATP